MQVIHYALFLLLLLMSTNSFAQNALGKCAVVESNLPIYGDETYPGASVTNAETSNSDLFIYTQGRGTGWNVEKNGLSVAYLLFYYVDESKFPHEALLSDLNAFDGYQFRVRIETTHNVNNNTVIIVSLLNALRGVDVTHYPKGRQLLQLECSQD